MIMENLILVLIGLLILIFIGLMWLRHQLVLSRLEVKNRWSVLFHDLEHRRDIIPLLLEAARQETPPDDSWRRLVEARAFLQQALKDEEKFQKEMELERALNEFVHRFQGRNLAFLDAKKLIEDESAVIEDAKRSVKSAQEANTLLQSKSPYSWVTRIL